jgi:N-methylhydantoinase A
LEIKRVLIPPYCGVLSALGMVVAPPVVDAARTVIHLGANLTDAEIEAEFARLSHEAAESMPDGDMQREEHFADVRFRGQSHELKIAVEAMTIAEISRRFYNAYRTAYGRPPSGRAIEVVTLRVRRVGRSPQVELPEIAAQMPAFAVIRETEVVNAAGEVVRAAVMSRPHLAWAGKSVGPFLLIDVEATTFVPAGWLAQAQPNGAVLLNRLEPT